MINYHPDNKLLLAFSSGELMTSFSCAVSVHLDKCPTCRHKVSEFTEQQASGILPTEYTLEYGGEFDHILNDILNDDSIDVGEVDCSKHIELGGESYILPKALSKLTFATPSSIGKISRMRAHLDEGSVRTSLLYIQPSGKVPQHTHNGFELTLVLKGDFEDESGRYGEGDFIFLEGECKHQPISKHGCLCMTVVSDSLHFTQGINKLLNPIGTYIY